MKDLILITAYCPDDERENILRNLVTSIEKYKNIFDVMIVSHTTIPIDIQKKVEYCFYDKKNEILTEWDLLNKPWFSPNGDRRIQSSFLSKKNTHLAIWRLMILGFSIAKNLSFSKVHHIEYDCEINEISEFLDNSQLLNENNSIVYMDIQDRVDDVMFGSFQSYFIPKIHDMLIKLDEEKIKDLIRNAVSKSPEGLLFKLINESGSVIIKNRNILEQKGNKFGIINSQSINKNPWSVPYYDFLTENVDFISWNTTNLDGLEYKIIVNNDRIIHIPKICYDCWVIRYLGQIQEINSIVILENDNIRDTFYLNSDEDRELFKKMSYRVKQN
jgi:hypothetical protein